MFEFSYVPLHISIESLYRISDLLLYQSCYTMMNVKSLINSYRLYQKRKILLQKNSGKWKFDNNRFVFLSFGSFKFILHPWQWPFKICEKEDSVPKMKLLLLRNRISICHANSLQIGVFFHILMEFNFNVCTRVFKEKLLLLLWMESSLLAFFGTACSL